VTTINETQQLIAKRQQQQLGRKQQKASRCRARRKKRMNWPAEEEKDEVVSKLKSQSNDLKKQIAVKKKRTVI
jgi:hypothetical protein